MHDTSKVPNGASKWLGLKYGNVASPLFELVFPFPIIIFTILINIWHCRVALLWQLTIKRFCSHLKYSTAGAEIQNTPTYPTCSWKIKVDKLSTANLARTKSVYFVHLVCSVSSVPPLSNLYKTNLAFLYILLQLCLIPTAGPALQL